MMNEYIQWAIGFALLMPAYLAAMSFVMWDNGFRILGWKFILRVTLLVEIILLIAAAYKHLRG